MKFSRLKLGAVGAFSLLLWGCASENTLKTAGLLAVAQGKDGAKSLDGTPVSSDVEATLHQAQDLRKAGDFQGAAKLLSQLVLATPDDARVLGEYSKTLIGLGRSDDALAFAERAIELQPSDWSLYSARGVALDQKGDYRTAQLSYDRALALKPGDPTVLSNAALSHIQAGDLAGAESLLLEAMQAGGDFPRIASNLALVRKLRGTGSPPPPASIAARESPPVATTAASAAPPAAPSVSKAKAPPVAVPRATALATPKDSTTARPDKAPPSVTAQAAPSPQSVTAAATPSAPSSVEKLKFDPAVRVQAIPKDTKAAPVVAKNVPAKADVPPAQTTPTLEAFSLRPALSEGNRPRQATAQNSGVASSQ
jgi:Flp pilus assembly protein TadD